MYPGKMPFRRMLCTTDDAILTSINGRICLNYRPPANPLPYDAEVRGLLPVWDIFMQDWRMVNVDACEIVNTIERKDFWEYFNNDLRNMTPNEKVNYMST